MRKQKGFLFFILCLLLVTACQAKSEQPLLRTTLSESYPGAISNVDRIQLLDGTSGGRLWVDEPGEVQSWIEQIKDIEFIPDDNQEGAVGYIYRVELYEGEEMKLRFTPQHMNGIYYESNPQLLEQVKYLFEESFE